MSSPSAILEPDPVRDDLAARVRALSNEDRYDEAWGAVRPLLLSRDDGAVWNLARTLLRRAADAGWAPPATRSARLAVLCSYEASELVGSLEIACRALGVAVELYSAPYGQLEQEVLRPDGPLAAFEPTHVLLAPTTADLGLPELAPDAEAALDAAAARWLSLWRRIGDTHAARVVQHGFVVPDETPFGNLALRLPGSRPRLVRALNERLGEAAAESAVLLVDCERLAARVGKRSWFDPRLWYVARRPYSEAALPLLARETAGVLAADLGLSARCVVLDLDDTLWGGIVGEQGADGVVVGEGPTGEAYAAFQEYLRALAQRGVLLAVASKNDLAAAREPFEGNPHMRLRLDDFAAFVADWRPKSEQIQEIARTLGLGLDALVFVDDNLAECAQVAAELPAVDTVPLAVPPSEFVRTLAASVRLEPATLTDDDLRRNRSYAARSQAAELQAAAASLPEFWRSLEMKARVRNLEPATVERVAQLTQKTNQFNLTLVRRTRDEVERLQASDDVICKTIELEDRFAQHGLVGVAIAVPEEAGVLGLDTLLLSCRVIGRTAERHLLSHVASAATAAGFVRLRGRYVEGPRNALVADVYPQLGFTPVADDVWEYDLVAVGPIDSPYLEDVE